MNPDCSEPSRSLFQSGIVQQIVHRAFEDASAA